MSANPPKINVMSGKKEERIETNFNLLWERMELMYPILSVDSKPKFCSDAIIQNSCIVFNHMCIPPTPQVTGDL